MSIRARVEGNRLIITADNESRADLADVMSRDCHAEMLVADELHEKWEFIAPEVVGALTDAPILTNADELEYNDDGDIIGVGTVAWFPDYAILDPWAALRNTGRVVFDIAEDNA